MYIYDYFFGDKPEQPDLKKEMATEEKGTDWITKAVFPILVSIPSACVAYKSFSAYSKGSPKFVINTQYAALGAALTLLGIPFLVYKLNQKIAESQENTHPNVEIDKEKRANLEKEKADLTEQLVESKAKIEQITELFKNQIGDLNQTNLDEKQKKENLEKEKEDLTKTVKGYEQQLAQLDVKEEERIKLVEKNATLNKEVTDALNKEVNELKIKLKTLQNSNEQKESLEKEKVELISRLEQLNIQLTALKTANEQQINQTGQLNEQIENLKQINSEEKQNKERLEKEKEELTTQLGQLNAKIETLQNEKEEEARKLNEGIDTRDRMIDIVKNNLKELETSSNEQKERLEKEKKQLTDQIENLNAVIEQNKEVNSKIVVDIKRIRRTNMDLRKEKLEILRNNGELQKTNEQLQQKIALNDAVGLAFKKSMEAKQEEVTILESRDRTNAQRIAEKNRTVHSLEEKIRQLNLQIELQNLDPKEKENLDQLFDTIFDEEQFLASVVVEGNDLLSSQLYPNARQAMSASTFGKSQLCDAVQDIEGKGVEEKVDIETQVSWWGDFRQVVTDCGKNSFQAFARGVKGVGMTVANTITWYLEIATIGFTRNAPDYKRKQVSAMFTNMLHQMNKEIYKNDSANLKHFEGMIRDPSLDRDPWTYLSRNIKAHIQSKVKADMSGLNELFELLNMPLRGLHRHGYNMDAPEQRYKFLMKLEEVYKAIDYEKQIDDYIACPADKRWEVYPHIKTLHMIATHLHETPIWEQATDELNQYVHHKDGETLNYEGLENRLRQDIVVMQKVEKENPMKIDRAGVNCDKLGMQNGNREATNYRQNYGSKLGDLVIGKLRAVWNRMGSPSMDVGGSGEPAQCNALYTLYIDALVADGKRAGFIGLQKSPKFDGTNFEGFESGDYEKNRTAAFILANYKPRWLGKFRFMNFSLDQILEDQVLKLKKPESLEEKGISQDIVDKNLFAKQLKYLMVNNELGFFGLEKKLIDQAIAKVNLAFFKGHLPEGLNDKQRWSFLILTYAMVILETITKEGQELHMFHINCKDGIDRAVIVILALLMISQFGNQCNPNLDPLERTKNIQDLITMFMHPAYFVKGQAVIPSRAPLAYFFVEQMAWAAGQGNSADRLAMLGDFAKAQFEPFKGDLT